MFQNVCKLHFTNDVLADLQDDNTKSIKYDMFTSYDN